MNPPGIAPDRDVLDMWTLYDHPRDFPNSYVARRFVIGNASEATGDLIVAPKAEDIRGILYQAGRVRLERHPGDDPVIMEVWL
jgi:hypothetical protein